MLSLIEGKSIVLAQYCSASRPAGDENRELSSAIASRTKPKRKQIEFITLVYLRVCVFPLAFIFHFFSESKYLSANNVPHLNAQFHCSMRCNLRLYDSYLGLIVSPLGARVHCLRRISLPDVRERFQSDLPECCFRALRSTANALLNIK